MGTMILKYAAIAALVIAALLKPTMTLQTLLGFVICGSGAAVAVQAMRAKKYVWAALFLSIALIFNPVLTVSFGQSRHLPLSAGCLVAFVLSLFLLHNVPKKTIASITEQNPESESL
jgi:uncharacterized membrane protein YccC